MKKYKVTALKQHKTDAYRDDNGKLVPATFSKVPDNSRPEIPVSVGPVKFVVKNGAVNELPDEIAKYLSGHAYYDLEEVGGKSA